MKTLLKFLKYRVHFLLTIYSGKIYVPKSKDEEAFYVQGQHEPLISEALFNRVQDVITRKKTVVQTTIASLDELPLRGF